MVNFHHFANIKKAININERSFILKKKINLLSLFGLYGGTNLYLHTWLITKTWLSFLVDDCKENYEIEIIKK